MSQTTSAACIAMQIDSTLLETISNLYQDKLGVQVSPAAIVNRALSRMIGYLSELGCDTPEDPAIEDECPGDPATIIAGERIMILKEAKAL